MNWLVGLITEVRQLRAEMSVPPSARPPLALIGAAPPPLERLARHRDLILTLGRLASAEPADAAPAGSAPFVIGEATGALAIAEFIDLAAERARLDKEIAGHAADIDRTAKKLANADFIARAPEEIVEESRDRLAEARDAKTRLEAAREDPPGRPGVAAVKKSVSRYDPWPTRSAGCAKTPISCPTTGFP